MDHVDGPGQYPGQNSGGSPPQWSPSGAVPPGIQYPEVPAAPVKSRKKLFVGLGIGCGVLLLIGAVIIAFAVVGVVRSAQDRERSEQERVEGFAGPVENYLQALADGDAEAALATFRAGRVTEESPLMTDEVLAVSQEANPIENIDVTAPESAPGGYVPVTATFTMGGDEQTMEFWVDGPYSADDEDTPYELSDSPATVTIPGRYDGHGPALTANGMEVEPGGTYPAFIGTYEFAVVNDMFALEGETTAVVTHEELYGPTDADAEVVLSETGMETFDELVREEVDECLASKKLDAGCGLEVPKTLSDGTELKDGTLERSLDSASKRNYENLDPELDPLNPEVVSSAGRIGTVDVTADCVKDGDSEECNVLGAPRLGRPSVDLTADDPEVEWR